MKRRFGFTLLELVIALSLMAILTVCLIPKTNLEYFAFKRDVSVFASRFRTALTRSCTLGDSFQFATFERGAKEFYYFSNINAWFVMPKDCYITYNRGDFSMKRCGSGNNATTMYIKNTRLKRCFKLTICVGSGRILFFEVPWNGR